jgi:DNA-directed RNA polymerase subunit RPC12/RpoP
MKTMLEGYKCERCGHTWVKRETTEGDPVICPKCKSPYWNRPKVNSTKKIAAIKHFKGKTNE